MMTVFILNPKAGKNNDIQLLSEKIKAAASKVNRFYKQSKKPSAKPEQKVKKEEQPTQEPQKSLADQLLEEAENASTDTPTA